jgi:DNA modification methylase
MVGAYAGAGMNGCQFLLGDCRTVLAELPDQSAHCCVTSPPYFGLRDYGVDGQIGLEQTPDDYVAQLVGVFREVWRVLRDDGTLWLNLGDSYAGSGKGGNPDAGKQATNAGSQSIGVLYGKTGESARHAAVTNVTRKTHEIGMKPKDLIGIPWRVAFALQSDGWYLRQDIIWSKPNPMPESVKDRCTKAHEYIFMLSKSARYFYDQDAIAEDAIYSGLKNQTASGYKDAKAFNGKHSDKQSGHGPRHAGFNDRWEKQEQHSGTRNKRSVWTVSTKPYSEAHFATFPPDLIEPCILAGCPKGGTVLDPFGGAGTTGLVADRLQRNAVLIELNPEYMDIASHRIADDRGGLFA